MLKLTIAIPNYNGGKFLYDCILSCTNISLNVQDYEILILDNQSTDNSPMIINELTNKFPNIRFITNPKNVGRIGNWNKCIEYANGKYILFLFTNDTLYEKNNVHELIEHMDKDESISATVSAISIKDKSGESIRRSIFTNTVKCSSRKFVSLCISRGILALGVHSSIFRLDDIKKNKNKFPEELPATADQVFSNTQVCLRQYVLFSPVPQTNWIATSTRFHFSIKLEDAMKEQMQSINLIAEKTNLRIYPNYLLTYFLLNFLFYINKEKKTERNLLALTLSYIVNTKSFRLDKLLINAIIKKLKSKNNFFELLLAEIINNSDPQIE